NLTELASHRHLSAAGLPPDEMPGSARSEIHLTYGKGPAFRSQHPMSNVLGPCMRIPDPVAWGIEDPRRNELAVCRRRKCGRFLIRCFCSWHYSLPFFSSSYQMIVPPHIDVPRNSVGPRARWTTFYTYIEWLTREIDRP